MEQESGRVPSPNRKRDDRALVSVAQAAALLGVHPNTIRAWTDSGRLPAYRINVRGDRRFRRGDVERLLAEGASLPPAAGATVTSRIDRQVAVLARLAQMGIGPSAISICRAVVDVLRTQLDYPRVAIYLASRGALRLETHAGYGVAPDGTLPLEAFATRASTPLTGSDAAHPAASADAAPPDRISLPLRNGSELVGLLVVEDPEGALDAGQLPFLEQVAGSVASAVGNARLLARARRELTRSRALRSITQELTGQLDLPAVLDEIADRTRGLFEADKVGLWLLGDGPFPFEPAASRAISDSFQATVRALTLEAPSVGVRAVLERRTFVVHHAGSDPAIGVMRGAYAAEGIETACLVPLVSNDRAVGIIGLYHAREHEWPQEELALAQSFANQAAVAISNARLYRSVAEQAARMRSIQDLSARLNRLTDVQAIAEAIVAEANALAAHHDIRIYTVDWEAGICEPIAFTDRLLGEGDFRERLRVAIGPGSFTGTVAATGTPLLINDALADDRGLTIEGTDDIDESMLVVPMLYEGRAVGVVALSKLGKNQFSEEDLATMSIFAGYAAQAIVNARSYERLQEQSTELERQLQSQRRLLAINEQLLGTLDQEDVLELIADGLKAVVSYDNLSIYRADHARQIMVPVLTRERHAEAVQRYLIPFGRGLMGWAIEHREPVLANDALNDPRAMQIPGTPNDPEALCVVPLIGDGEVIGSLNIGRIGAEEAYFSATDFELIKLFAAQASIALRNADTHYAVSVRAETDALTSLGNHGAFQGYLAARLEAADGTGEEAARRVGLLMMDLDRFKNYNDQLGHPAGDALLHAIGQTIEKAARTGDRVFRYGGDEFALVLDDVTAAEAAVVGDRIRRAVARLTATESTPVTITVGAAAFPDDAPDKNALISAADTALYHGKQSGENRVIRFDDVPREMRDLRGTLDQLARAALQNPEEATNVEHLVEQAALLGTADESAGSVRDALLAIARSLDTRDTASRGHADRVGRLSRTVAHLLGCTDDESATIELAGRLHGLTAIGGSELAAVRSLAPVAEIISAERALRAAPDRRRRAPGRSLGAEIVAAANAYDLAVRSAADGTSPTVAIEAVKARNLPVRQEVRDALERAVLQPQVIKRMPAGRRRRDHDQAGEPRRGAA